MPEFFVEIQSEDVTASVGGKLMEDRQGNSITNFSIMTTQEKSKLLDVYNLSWEILATMLFANMSVKHVLNEETTAGETVVFTRRNESHTFQTEPPIKVTLVDF